jgi:uncharacterized damage-inducible protein DinB
VVTANYIATLYDYDAWASTRVLDTAAQLDPPALDIAPLAGLGSLRRILSHTLSAVWIWRSRLEGVSPSAPLDPTNFRNLATLRERWVSELAGMHALIAGLDDALLAEPLAYRTTGGTPQATPRWQILVHLVNHGTQHRSEAAALLTAFGHSPGDLDMIAFFRAKVSSADVRQ